MLFTLSHIQYILYATSQIWSILLFPGLHANQVRPHSCSEGAGNAPEAVCLVTAKNTIKRIIYVF